MKLFLSYTQEDIKKVHASRSILELNGEIECWDFQRDGDVTNPSIEDDVRKAISQSRYMVLFWSQSVAKEPGWVLTEFRIASEKEKQGGFGIIIIKLDDTPLHPKMGDRKYHKYNEQLIVTIRENIIKKRATGQLASNVPQVITVENLMTPESKLIKIPIKAKAVDAFIHMDAAEVRHLIVINPDGSLAGFMSSRDISKKFPPKLSQLRKVTDDIDVNLYQQIVNEMAALPVQRLMAPYNKLITLTPSASINDALEELTKEHGFGRISAMPIVTGKKVMGVLSYLDLLCSNKLQIPNTTVGQKKTQKVMYANTTTELGLVMLEMEQAGIRHIPIVDANGYLVGMIDDVTCLWLTHSAFNLHTYPVEKFMQPVNKITCLIDQDNLSQVAKFLFCEDKDTGALPVVEDRNAEHKKLTGIISYIDILKSMKESFQP